MHVTAKADYAVRAVIELADSKQDAPRKVDDIAQAQGIPVSFLENILTQLRSSGLVRSQRGPEGGYWLAQPAENVSLAQIIRAVEGPLVGVRGQRPEEIEYVGSAEMPAAGLDRAAREPAQSARAGQRCRRGERQAAERGPRADEARRSLGNALGTRRGARPRPRRWRRVRQTCAPLAPLLAARHVCCFAHSRIDQRKWET